MSFYFNGNCDIIIICQLFSYFYTSRSLNAPDADRKIQIQLCWIHNNVLLQNFTNCVYNTCVHKTFYHAKKCLARYQYSYKLSARGQHRLCNLVIRSPGGSRVLDCKKENAHTVLFLHSVIIFITTISTFFLTSFMRKMWLFVVRGNIRWCSTWCW